MPKLNISTASFGDDLLFPHRTIRVGEKAVQTPTKALSAKRLQGQEEVREDSRGVNELYCQVNSKKLKKERRGSTKIRSKLREGKNKTKDGEITFAFFGYTDTQSLPVVDANYLVELQKKFSDVLTVPMMPELFGSINEEDGTDDPTYGSYKRSVLRFLEAAQERAPNMSIMGTLPPLSWEFNTDLMEVYAAHDVSAYCLNFNRRKITAARQVDMVSPLMRSIAARGIEEHVLFYAINLAPGSRDSALGGRPAADFASAGMGFDIVGDNHVAPSMPEEAYEDMEDDEVTFRLFDKEDYIYREIPVDNLPSNFPEDSRLDANYVAQRVRNSPNNSKYRLQAVVNAEQMAVALADLRDAPGSELDNIAAKPGTTAQFESAYRTVRESFDDEFFQSGLSEFF